MEYPHQESIECAWGLVCVLFGLTGVALALVSVKIHGRAYPLRRFALVLFVSTFILTSGLFMMSNAALRHRLIFPQKKTSELQPLPPESHKAVRVF